MWTYLYCNYRILFQRQPHKMVKHKQSVGNLPTNCLSMFDHFVGLALRGILRAFEITSSVSQCGATSSLSFVSFIFFYGQNFYQLIRDRCQISLLISTNFRWINYILLPLKSSENRRSSERPHKLCLYLRAIFLGMN